MLHADSLDAAGKALRSFRDRIAPQFTEAVERLERGVDSATQYVVPRRRALNATWLHMKRALRNLDAMAPPRNPAATRSQMKDELRGAGLRVTPSRMAVLALLRGSATPLSHGDAADKLGEHAADRATVYRNLIDLVEAGLLRRIDVGDHVWRFEAVDRAHDKERHPHFVCTECGEVECLPDLKLSARQGRTPKSLQRDDLEVQVRGRCDACA